VDFTHLVANSSSNALKIEVSWLGINDAEGLFSQETMKAGQQTFRKKRDLQMKKTGRPLVLLGSLGLMFSWYAPAQTFKTLHDFAAGVDGGNPQAGLILSSNTLYGTAYGGGSSGRGMVFALNTEGTGFVTLYSFTAPDGSFLNSRLLLSSNVLYGTAPTGGSSNQGTVFALSTDGTGFTILHTFTPNYNPTNANSDGAHPRSGLALSGNTLYGTASLGGNYGCGTGFALGTDGTGFTTLHSFTENSYKGYANGDGANPSGELVVSGKTLYGTASAGGYYGSGTVFALNSDGTSFRTLYHFTQFSAPPSYTNSDGGSPDGELLLSGNTLYGEAYWGGIWGYGTVFAINTDGTGFRVLHTFTGGSDGSGPSGGLILSGNTLYGTAMFGGGSNAPRPYGTDSSAAGWGTVFALNTDGTGFRALHSFTPTHPYTNSDGANPPGGLVLSGNTLYGTTEWGGRYGSGTVFSILMQPQLTVAPSGQNVILTWPTNYAGFDYTGYGLQSTANLASPVWNTNLPAPVVISGLNTVTNPISGALLFYRLVQ
jgi:uncharacterized repeat protein (TIGR03803 family)